VNDDFIKKNIFVSNNNIIVISFENYSINLISIIKGY